MNIIDQALSQFAGTDITAIAARVGLTPEQVQSAIAALGRSEPEPSDTVTTAATRAELPVDRVRAVYEAIGGREMLERLTGALSQGGGIASTLSGLFGKA